MAERRIGFIRREPLYGKCPRSIMAERGIGSIPKRSQFMKNAQGYD